MYYSYSLLKKAKQHIANGGVIAYPTESCYGFGCDPSNVKAIRNLLIIKKRISAKGLIIVASDLMQVHAVVSQSVDLIGVELAKYWPGFYSLIMAKNSKLNNLVSGRHNKIAVRVSSDKHVRQICSFIDIPIVSTSANLSGKYSVKTYKECVRQFGNRVLVLPGKIGGYKKPSSIIDWDSKKVIRE